jgi:hypothetical protein
MERHPHLFRRKDLILTKTTKATHKNNKSFSQKQQKLLTKTTKASHKN